jgi:hypothetical protein
LIAGTGSDLRDMALAGARGFDFEGAAFFFGLDAGRAAAFGRAGLDLTGDGLERFFAFGATLLFATLRFTATSGTPRADDSRGALLAE